MIRLVLTLAALVLLWRAQPAPVRWVVEAVQIVAGDWHGARPR